MIVGGTVGGKGLASKGTESPEELMQIILNGLPESTPNSDTKTTNKNKIDTSFLDKYDLSPEMRKTLEEMIESILDVARERAAIYA